MWVPTEDDGTFEQTTSKTEQAALVQPNFDRQDQAQLRQRHPLFGNELAAFHDWEHSDNAPNKQLEATAKLADRVLKTQFVSEPPHNSEFIGGNHVSLTIGLSLDFGSSNDVRNGYARLRVWNLDGVDQNAGALFFVIEETPPISPKVQLRTMTPLPLNPTEFWWPALSRKHYLFVPA